MPEVKAVMAQYFNGRPLRQQNISEWKQGGYRDWLHHRQLLEQKRELAADAKDLSDTASGLPDSLFGMLTLDYTDLMMNGDKETPEEFEQRRKRLSLVSHDIARMHRCHINTRRVEVQEARLERDEEKTEEQLHFKFMEWVENPAIRRACILEPMEANRQTRQHFGMPPTPDDILIEKLTKNDPNKKPAGYRPKPAEKSNPETKPSPPNRSADCPNPQHPPTSEKTSEVQEPENSAGARCRASEAVPLPSTPYADKTASQLISEIEEQQLREKASRLNPASPPSEKAPESNKDTNRPVASPSPGGEGELNNKSQSGPSNSNLKPQNSTLPKPPLSDYERALLEGKTFLEALYLQAARPKPGSQPPAPPQGSSAWDTFSEKVDVYSGFRLGPAISLRSALSRNTPG